MKRQHRRKELTESQLLKKENKDLKAQVRTLEHHIRELEKHHRIYESAQDEEVINDTEDTYIKRQPCSSCGKGYYEEFEILDKVFATCNVCSDRKKIR